MDQTKDRDSRTLCGQTLYVVRFHDTLTHEGSPSTPSRCPSTQVDPVRIVVGCPDSVEQSTVRGMLVPLLCPGGRQPKESLDEVLEDGGGDRSTEKVYTGVQVPYQKEFSRILFYQGELILDSITLV